MMSSLLIKLIRLFTITFRIKKIQIFPFFLREILTHSHSTRIFPQPTNKSFSESPNCIKRETTVDDENRIHPCLRQGIQARKSARSGGENDSFPANRARVNDDQRFRGALKSNGTSCFTQAVRVATGGAATPVNNSSFQFSALSG